MSNKQVGLGLFDEENFTQGGFQGGRAKIVSSRFQQVQPDQNKPGREPMWVLGIKDAAGEAHDIRYGLGKLSAERFRIVEGGKRVEGLNGAQLNKSCKVALLIKSIGAAAFEWPDDAMPKKAGQSPDVSALDGQVADFKSVEMEVGDKILAERKAKNQGAPTVLLIDSFVNGVESKGKATVKDDEPEAEPEGTDGGEADQEAILKHFIEVARKPLAKGALSLTDLKVKVLQAVEEDEQLKDYTDDLMALLDDDDNLTGEDFGLVVEGKGKNKTVSDPNAKPAKTGLKLGKK